MASIPIVLLAALGAILYFSCIGLALARWLRFDWAPAGSVAPALGWGVFSAVSFPLQDLLGFTQVSTAVLALAALVASLVALAFMKDDARAAPRLPAWACLLAAGIALLALAALLPKHADGGILIGTAASDHSKIAMIDEMTRLGLPVGNPFFGQFGARSTLSYYYLWHFGAAQLSILAHVSGWEADAAMTGFTAYASILLMMGIATRLHEAQPSAAGRGGRRGPAAAVAWVALLSLAGSLWPVLFPLLGPQGKDRLFASYADLQGWMAQASWVPQHLASACCVVLAVILLAGLSGHRRIGAVLVVGALAAAGFGSSAWVGGVTFAVAAAGVGAVGLAYAKPPQRLGFVMAAVAGAAVAVVLALPFLHGEFSTLATRHGGSPIGFHPYEVVGAIAPPGLRRVLDYPAYWLVLLPIDLPAIYPAGAVALALCLRRVLKDRDPRPYVPCLAVLAVASLGVAWLFASTIANNDLGWRAILPAVLVLTPFAAAALASWIEGRAYVAAAVSLVLFALSVPDRVIFGSIAGKPTENASDFAKAPALWAAVRKYAGPSDRVADNPLYLDDVTDWPVNPSWAMLSNRPSCYSGWETARAYVDLPRERIDALDAQFIRIFGGKAAPDDIRQMAQDYGCRVVVLNDDDGAWDADPFAHTPYYRLAEEREDQWRIYVATASRPSPGGAGPVRK